MIRGYVNQGERLQPVENAPERLDSFVWIDLVSPSREEEADVEARLGVNVPTRDEMSEIEISSRLYQDDGTIFMRSEEHTSELQSLMRISYAVFCLQKTTIIS